MNKQDKDKKRSTERSVPTDSNVCSECHLIEACHEDGLCDVCHFGGNIGGACDPGECKVEGCYNNPDAIHKEKGEPQ